MIIDENRGITDNEILPLDKSLKVLRYRTIKKNTGLGWWSAVVLLEDHEKKQVCFYRWRRKAGAWKRDKKLPFRKRGDWSAIKEAVESFLGDLDG
ncbi:MAG: hypothetical protein KAS86_05240 [Candidatus Omnitrophica bacterium]|nr:hypothetical protein [Candidatus Omnitrophota bacterium]